MCECQGNPLARITLALGLPYLLILLFLIDFQTLVWISKHAVLYRGIKVHPCDLNAGTQLAYHLMNY